MTTRGLLEPIAPCKAPKSAALTPADRKVGAQPTHRACAGSVDIRDAVESGRTRPATARPPPQTPLGVCALDTHPWAAPWAAKRTPRALRQTPGQWGRGLRFKIAIAPSGSSKVGNALLFQAPTLQFRSTIPLIVNISGNTHPSPP